MSQESGRSAIRSSPVSRPTPLIELPLAARFRAPAARALPLVLAAFLGAACKDRDVEVYRAPKQPAEAVAAMPAGHPPMGEAARAGELPRAGAPAQPSLEWQAPAGWKPKPAGGMRLATYIIPAKGGQAELAVVAIAGSAGGSLANVNRWRGQLGLPPIDQGQLMKQALTVNSKAGTALLVDLAGADRKSGLLAAILPTPAQTWFFKITGPADATAAAKPAFLEFLGSLH